MEKKFITAVFYLLIPLGLLVSCTEQEYADLFDGQESIYFAIKSNEYSLGEKPSVVKELMFNVPVKVIGDSKKNIRYFNIKVVNDNTSLPEGFTYSTEGVTHAPLKEQYEVLKDSINAYIPITLLRDGMKDGEYYQITLQIQEEGDFKLGPKESLQYTVSFNNDLVKPVWWPDMERYLGIYHKKKYKKFIDIYGSSITPDYLQNNFLLVLTIFREVRDFFVANPEDGVEFPDVHWPV